MALLREYYADTCWPARDFVPPAASSFAELLQSSDVRTYSPSWGRGVFGCGLAGFQGLNLIMVNPRLAGGLPKFDSSGSLPFVVFSVLGFDFAIAVRPLGGASNRKTSGFAGGYLLVK